MTRRPHPLRPETLTVRVTQADIDAAEPGWSVHRDGSRLSRPRRDPVELALRREHPGMGVLADVLFVRTISGEPGRMLDRIWRMPEALADALEEWWDGHSHTMSPGAWDLVLLEESGPCANWIDVGRVGRAA